MLQKKRDEFRKEIRRQQLDKYRDQKRKLLQQRFINKDIFKDITRIWTDIHTILNSIAQKTYHTARINSNSHRAKNELIIEHKQDEQNFYLLLGKFSQLNQLAPYEQQHVFTKYMNGDCKAAQRVVGMLGDLVGNEWMVGEEEEEGMWVEGIVKYPQIVRARVVSEMLRFMDTLQLGEMVPEVVKVIIDSVWRMFTDGNDLLYSDADNYYCLKATLSIICKSLQNSQSPIIHHHMQQRGLSSQLIKLIDRVLKLPLSLQLHSSLLHLLSNYLNSQLTLSENQTSSSQIGDITLQTSQVNQKQTYLAFCIAYVDKSQQSLYPIVFSCVSKILQIHEFLVDNLKQVYWERVCGLILSGKREVQVEALGLLNDFTYHSQRVLDYLLSKCKLFDMLYKRLMIEKTISDNFSTTCIQKIAYIICNALLTDDKKLKKSCLEHYIWQQVFNSLHPSNKLFPLVMTMPYFFTARGHKNFDKFLRPYLETLRNFEWQECRYVDSIKDSVMKTFYNASQQWQQHQYILFLNILQQENFLFLVEDLVDQTDLEQIKDIEIE